MTELKELIIVFGLHQGSIFYPLLSMWIKLRRNVIVCIQWLLPSAHPIKSHSLFKRLNTIPSDRRSSALLLRRCMDKLENKWIPAEVVSLCANEKGSKSNGSSSHGSIHSENQMTIKPLNRGVYLWLSPSVDRKSWNINSPFRLSEVVAFANSSSCAPLHVWTVAVGVGVQWIPTSCIVIESDCN